VIREYSSIKNSYALTKIIVKARVLKKTTPLKTIALRKLAPLKSTLKKKHHVRRQTLKQIESLK
jgi:hypothetical protein